MRHLVLLCSSSMAQGQEPSQQSMAAAREEAGGVTPGKDGASRLQPPEEEALPR